MFKLIKVINSGTSVPELVKIKATGNKTYKAGAVYYVNEMGLTNVPSLDDDCKFIPIKTTVVDEKNDTVTGYIVCEEMLFETDHPSVDEPLWVGNSYSFHKDKDGDIIGISEIPGGDIKLINTDSYETTGMVTVLLKW